jgi:hypothetical protein
MSLFEKLSWTQLSFSDDVGVLLFLAACFGFQSFKAQDQIQKTWSSGE